MWVTTHKVWVSDVVLRWVMYSWVCDIEVLSRGLANLEEVDEVRKVEKLRNPVN